VAGAVGFTCRCGALRGRLTDADPAQGTHMVCHCADCRRANAHFGLDGSEEDGVHIWQTTPDRLRIERGADHLRLMRLTEGGLSRWYAGCCDTPLFNTLATPRLPFVGVLTARLDAPERLGPVVAEAFVPAGEGRTRHVRGGLVMWRFIRRTVAARLSGRWRRTPFFDVRTGRPIAVPEVLASD
jgi:hypothetical protein